MVEYYIDIARCLRCDSCIVVCLNDAIIKKNGLISIQKEKCNSCGRCKGSCIGGAIKRRNEDAHS